MPQETAAENVSDALRLDGRPLESSADVAAYLGVNHGRMIWTLYKAPDHTRYTQFEIPKRSGGMRPINAPIGMLRGFQDRLCVDLQRLYRPHPNAHGFIKERNVVSNAQEHVGKRWVLNVDLADFFPTINFGRIRGLFMKPPFEMAPAAATVCAQIVTHRNGLPQGAPTSPVLSNFIASTLDRRLLRLARHNRLAYTRYADDITFSSNAVLFPPALALREPIAGGTYKVEAGDALVQAIAQSGFEINAGKVRLQSRSFRQNVTGLNVNSHVNVARKRVRKVRAMIHAWRKFGIASAAHDHFAKHRESGQKRPSDPAVSFRNVVYGQLSFIKMVRGADDAVFLKLCAQLLDLDPNPSKFVRQMMFGADDYDIFISHASEDKPLIARPIYEACERLGMKAFLDEEHIGFGQSFTSKINTALGSARTILAVVSSTSVDKEWPLLEINTALAYEASGSKRVIPVLVGRPDLSKLPLIRAKRWLEWDGDADKVAAHVKASLVADQPREPPQSQQSVAGSDVPKQDDAQSPTSTPKIRAPTRAAPPRRPGIWSRLFGRSDKQR